MLNTILALLFSLALAQSGINNDQVARENKETMPIENNVVQTVKVEKKKEVVKATSKPVVKEERKEEWMTFKLTGYSNHENSTGKNKGDKDYGITASGLPTQKDVTIAADWSVLPVGTVVLIEDVGERVVHDKGGKIKGHRIDVYFEKEQDALDFGVKKNARVRVVKWGEKN